MHLSIRPALVTDRPELAIMLGEVIAYFESLAPGSFPAPPTSEELDATAGLSFAENPVCATIIPVIDGKIAGYLAYHFGVWEIHGALIVAGLYVRPQFQQQGVGRALMAEASKLARARGVSHVAWEVWRLNPRAIAFYRALGADVHDDNVRMAMRA